MPVSEIQRRLLALIEMANRRLTTNCAEPSCRVCREITTILREAKEALEELHANQPN